MPTINTTDPLALMASMRLEDGRPWAEVAEQFQLDDARAILTPGPDDPRCHWLGRGKGGSKTTDLAATALTWLECLASPLDEGYTLASDQDQARRLLTRAQGLITRTPGLDRLFEVQSWQIVHRTTGARVVALAADAAGAEGTVSPLYLVDELPQWADTKAARALWDAAYSSIPKGMNLPGGLRFAVIGHAGIEGSWQHRLYEELQGSDLWRFNDVPGPLPWLDPRLLAEQERILTPDQYARRVLNRWSSGDDVLVTVDDLRANVTLSGPLQPRQGERYVIAVDLGIKSDRTVAAVCHAESNAPGPVREAPVNERALYAKRMHAAGQLTAEGLRLRLAEAGDLDVPTAPHRVVLDRMEVWQGSRRSPVRLEDVESWILQAHGTYNGAEVVLDPWQAIGLAQRLRERGVLVREFTFSSSSVGRLASTLHRLLREGLFALPDDDDLLDELAHVRLVERTPGVVRLDHDSGRHDDRAMALALAATHLLERPPSPPTRSVAHGGRAVAAGRGRGR